MTSGSPPVSTRRTPGLGLCFRYIDADDPGMGMGGAQHGGAGLPGRLHVVHIASGAADQIRVFLTRNRLSNAEFAHRSSKLYYGA